MKPPNLASMLRARGVHLPVRPFQSRPRAMRFGCAAAASSMYAVGVGKLRRHNRYCLPELQNLPVQAAGCTYWQHLQAVQRTCTWGQEKLSTAKRLWQ